MKLFYINPLKGCVVVYVSTCCHID